MDELGSDTGGETLASSSLSESQYVLQAYASGQKAFNDPSGAQTGISHDVRVPLNIVFDIQERQTAGGTAHPLRRMTVRIPSDTLCPIDCIPIGYAVPGAPMANNPRCFADTRCPYTLNKDMVEVIVNLSPQSKANITISPQLHDYIQQ